MDVETRQNRIRFEQAWSEFPSYTAPHIDLSCVLTVEDLVAAAQHEIDLYDEGEESDILNLENRAYYQHFVFKYGKKRGKL